MRSYKTEGIIIKRRNFGEADRMLTVFTQDEGKISVKATGIRKIASRRSPHVELLNHAVLGLYKGNHAGVYTLVEASCIEPFSDLKDNLTRIGLAYHICELIDGLCPENQENERVFFLLRNVLNRLGIEEEVDSAIILHDFEVELLRTLGYWHKTREESTYFNTQAFIENLLERKLKSKSIFGKLES